MRIVTAGWRAGLTAGLLAVVLCPIVPWAQEADRQILPDPPGRWWSQPRLVQELGLRPEQVRRIESIFREQRQRLAELKTRYERELTEFQALLAGDQIDRTAVDVKLDDVHRARSAMVRSTLNMQLDIRACLDPAQRERLKGLRGRGGPGAGERDRGRPRGAGQPRGRQSGGRL